MHNNANLGDVHLLGCAHSLGTTILILRATFCGTLSTSEDKPDHSLFWTGRHRIGSTLWVAYVHKHVRVSFSGSESAKYSARNVSVENVLLFVSFWNIPLLA